MFYIIFIFSNLIYASNYRLVDQSCVIVSDQPPILRSEIEKLSEEKSISFLDAKKELIYGRLLWIYAQNNPKYDINYFRRSAENHIREILDKQKLSIEQLEHILQNPPYKISLEQFKFDTATAYLQQTISSYFAGQIGDISDEDVKKELKNNTGKEEKFDIVFISIKPKNNTKKSLDEAFNIAKNIDYLTKSNTLDDIIKKYHNNSSISFVGPIVYDKGKFSKQYEDEINKSKNHHISKPFLDDGSVNLIWKIKHKLNKGSSLEKVRKYLYEKLVAEKYKSVIDSLMNKSTVDDRNCK